MPTVSAHELFVASRKILPEEAQESWYAWNAMEQRLWNYRVITNAEVVHHKLFKGLPKHIINFINEYERVLVIANVVQREVVSVVLRALTKREFIGYGKLTALYGIGMMSEDFRYGMPVVLVEGTLDRDALLPIYPNVLALLTASLSSVQLEMLEVLTNRVLLLYDNDASGLAGMEKDGRRLKERGFVVKPLQHPRGLKDAGGLVEAKFRQESTAQEWENRYQTMISLWVDNAHKGRW